MIYCTPPPPPYPPSGDAAKKLIDFLFENKRKCPDLPLALTVHRKDYPRRYVPFETNCALCSTHPELSEPKLVTGHGKLLTMKGLIQGIETFYRSCPNCNCCYHYQEFTEGVHNFNNFWMLGLDVCDYTQQQLKVHTAIGRTIQAIERWLQLEPESLPKQVIRSAYLHFEALTDHKYEFFCVQCGHHPPLLVTDVDKKGIFELSDLPMPNSALDDPDEVDAQQCWNNVNKGILYRLVGSGSFENPFEVHPSYDFWSPYIGPFSRRSESLVNSEHRKCHHEKDVDDFGCRKPSMATVDDISDLLEEGSAKVVKDLCLRFGLSGAGSKKDNIKALKDSMGSPKEFIKIFSKIWGGSGGWLGASCPHSICYGLKWIIRQEGARDHVDMLLSFKEPPNIVSVDFANMVAAHAEKRKPGFFSPHLGRVAEPTDENIGLAKDGMLQVNFPWFPSGNSDICVTNAHPVTKVGERYCLFDAWHEKNSSNPADLLRSTRCVPELEGISTEVAEHLNNSMNRNNYFMNSMCPNNSLFLMRLVVHLQNQERNESYISKVQGQLSGVPYLDELDRLRMGRNLANDHSTKRVTMRSLLSGTEDSEEPEVGEDTH